MPYEAYIGYVADKNEQIGNGESIVIEVRDLDTFERLVVRAKVGMPGQPVEGGDELWILDWVEKRQEEPWSIVVEEELDEDAAEACRADIDEKDLRAASEDSHQYAGGRGRGAAMPEMMGQEEARKFYENVVGKKKDSK
jgi:hypothetical protein